MQIAGSRKSNVKLLFVYMSFHGTMERFLKLRPKPQKILVQAGCSFHPLHRTKIVGAMRYWIRGVLVTDLFNLRSIIPFVALLFFNLKRNALLHIALPILGCHRVFTSIPQVLDRKLPRTS